MTKRSRARMTAYEKSEVSDDARRMETFARPAVEVPAIIQPGDKDPIDDVSSIERSTTSSPLSPQPEGCPLTQPEDDDGSDSSESESSLPILYVLPDTTVIVSPHDTPAVFKPFRQTKT